MRAVLIIVLFVLAGFTAGYVFAESQRPSCPTEDSCQVDYRDGEWHITEDTP